jgi:hypothetical protein
LRIGMLAQVCARAAACAGRIQDILEIDPAQNPDFSASEEPVVFGFFSSQIMAPSTR